MLTIIRQLHKPLLNFHIISFIRRKTKLRSLRFSTVYLAAKAKSSRYKEKKTIIQNWTINARPEHYCYNKSKFYYFITSFNVRTITIKAYRRILFGASYEIILDSIIMSDKVCFKMFFPFSRVLRVT